MRLIFSKIFLTCFQFLIVLEAANSGVIFPLLSTSWYYKPGPMESIVFGLIIVKVLAIRLGATLVGVPYHLNDIFDKKNLLNWTTTRRKRHLNVNETEHIPSSLSKMEIQALERILLALRRIDSHDCFIQYICRLHQHNESRTQVNSVDSTWLKIFRLRPRSSESKLSKNDEKHSVWNIYEKALSSRTNCTGKYSNCPLTPEDVDTASILIGMF